MNPPLIPFGGNCMRSVVRQGKYRVVHHDGGFAIEVVIETPDDVRSFPTSRDHPDLVKMVNAVKVASQGAEGGQFYINEWQQVIVPVGNPVKYIYAGEYPHPVILKLGDEEFSGRPHDEQGNLLKPGDPWTGRPRPGIAYTLKAGGADVAYTFELGPGREKFVRLSKIVGEDRARQTARKISAVKGNTGGRFYINEFRAFFGPRQTDDGWHYVFIGMLTDEDAWFTKWTPQGPASGASPNTGAPASSPPSPASPAGGGPPVVEAFEPVERKLEIAEDATGHSLESLFAAYLRGAKWVRVEDSYMVKPHQIANLLRLCELVVRLGSARKIELVTKEITEDSRGKLETIKRSLAGYGVDFLYSSNPSLHDRQIVTDTGWEISLGRGLDIYKRPENWLGVGASDFALRSCFPTTILFHRLGQANAARKTA